MTTQQQTIRLATNDGGWKAFACSVVPGECPTTIRVPEFRGQWIIAPEGMVANVGGNDWRIYTLHPDDCAALCNVETAIAKGKGAQ